MRKRSAAVMKVSPRLEPGTFDWMVATFKRSPKYIDLPAKTRKSYDDALALIGDHVVKDGRRVGSFSLKAISGAVVDKLHAKLLTRQDGTERRRTVNLAMAVARRAWKVARRASDRVPLENPFERMGLTYCPRQTRPVTRDEMMKLVEAADVVTLPESLASFTTRQGSQSMCRSSMTTGRRCFGNFASASTRRRGEDPSSSCEISRIGERSTCHGKRTISGTGLLRSVRWPGSTPR